MVLTGSVKNCLVLDVSCHLMPSVHRRHFVWFASVLAISVFVIFHVSEAHEDWE